MIEYIDTLTELQIIAGFAIAYLIADVIKIAMDESEVRKNGDLPGKD